MRNDELKCDECGEMPAEKYDEDIALCESCAASLTNICKELGLFDVDEKELN